MALKLTKPLRDGSTAEYWRVSPAMNFELMDKTLHYCILLYVNETTRRADVPPVAIPLLESTEGFQHPAMTGQAVTDALATGDPRAAIYTLLKTIPFFAGAEDC